VALLFTAGLLVLRGGVSVCKFSCYRVSEGVSHEYVAGYLTYG